jgi:TPR repeat protein
MMWQMCVAERNWCDFVSYDPRLNDQRRLFVKRLSFNQENVDHIENHVKIFLDEMALKLTRSNLNITSDTPTENDVLKFLRIAMEYDLDGGTESHIKAVEYYKVAAEGGNAEAQYNLGYKYAEGEGILRDDKAAVYWYIRAAEQGDQDAQCNLGYAYETGQGVDANLNLALFWYAQAAEQEQPDAAENLKRLVPSYADQR